MYVNLFSLIIVATFKMPFNCTLDLAGIFPDIQPLPIYYDIFLFKSDYSDGKTCSAALKKSLVNFLRQLMTNSIINLQT